MITLSSDFDRRVVLRLLEFCEENASWSRRLWQSGTILIGRELAETCDPAFSASDLALKSLQDELRGRVAIDPGLGPRETRSETMKLVSGPASGIVKPGHRWQALSYWIESARRRYLTRWADELALPPTIHGAEVTARLIASHALDEGISRHYLHKWLTYRVKYAVNQYSLADICRELDELLAAGPQSIEVLVPLAAHAPLPRPIPDGWLTSRQVVEWRKSHIPGSGPLRQYGGMKFTVSAYDIYAAAEQARDRIAAIRDRSRVGGRHEVVPDAQMWLSGVPDPLPTAVPPRPVEVHSFERQDSLWTHAVRPDIEAAMELLAPLERGPVPAALTGAWSAVESLLVGPGDDAKHVAAQRLAQILAGGHLRAEMTSLAWAHAKGTDDELARQIEGEASNQARAEVATRHLMNGGALNLTRTEDQHALDRARPALTDPHRYVSAVRVALEHPMRAIYRQRNLLSHAGGTSGVAIKPTLERTAPLIAAAMDRIVHVALVSDKSALELAAISSVRQEALRGEPPITALRILEL